MEWRSMKTARIGMRDWYTIQWNDGSRSVMMLDFVPNGAIAWAKSVAPEPFAGDPAELERGDA